MKFLTKSNWNLDHKIMGKTNHNIVTICHLNGGKQLWRVLGHKSDPNKFLGLVE